MMRDHGSSGTMLGMKTVTRALLVFSVLSSSCATLGVRGEAIHPAGMDAAADAAWAVYGRHEKRPTVLIVEGAGLTCKDPNSGKPGFEVEVIGGSDMAKGNGWLHKACREGYTLSAWKISVSYHGEPWEQTVLAHEELHAAQEHEGVFDPNHNGADWNPGGKLEKANAAIAALPR